MTIELIYKDRNKKAGERLFEKERGEMFSQWIGRGKKILDLGCRDCSLTKYFLNGNNILGLDLDSNALNLCPSGIKTQQFDLNNDWHLDKKDFFDTVVSSEVIEHLYCPEEVINKIKFVLKNGGYFIGSVPNAFNLKNRIRLFLGNKKDTPLGEPTHINQFSYGEMHNLLKSHFREVEMVPMVQKKWRWFAKILPGLGSFLIIFKASK